MISNVGRSNAAPGQAGLMIMAISILILLVLGGTTLSNMANMSAKRNIYDRRTMQAYYVAQAGLQEALATRMMPRSNYLNFIQPTGSPAVVTPYYNNSGLVFQQPNTQQQLLGVYRYVVLGGDPSRKADGSYYGIPSGPPFSAGTDVTNTSNPTPRLVTFQSLPPASPFYIVSNGLTCIKNLNTNGTDVGIDQFMGTSAAITSARQLMLDNTQSPQCKSGYKIQETTLVARVALEQESGALDKVNSVRQFRDRTNVSLTSSAFIPGTGWANQFNFNTAWSSQSNTAGQSPGRPTRLVFFKFGPNNIYKSVDLTGALPVIANIPIDASMMLDFDGAIDYRSLSNSLGGTQQYLYDKDLNGCKGGNSNNCAVQLFATKTGTQYTGMLVVPILPSLTKVLLLAPLGNNLSSGNTYQLNIYPGAIRSFSYAPGTNAAANAPMAVRFTTQ